MSSNSLVSEKWGNLLWKLDQSTGHLTISGSGSMEDFDHGSDCAWSAHKNAIQSVTIEEGVTSIGSAAFCKCSNLKIVEIPSSVSSIFTEAFADCISLISIKIPMSVTFIGRGAFIGCSGLKSIEIPQNVTSIGSDAFKGCDSLIQIENGVKYVVHWAIECDTSVRTVVLRADTVGIGCNAFSCCVHLKRMKLPTGVRSISTCAFSNCKNLKSIVLPPNLTSIGEMAFYGCNSLKTVLYPKRRADWERASVGYGNASLLKALRFGRGNLLLTIKNFFV